MSGHTTHVARLTWAEVCARRLDRQALSSPAPDAEPADVVAAMCGAHAQVMSAAELSIGLRIPGTTLTDVRDALWTERSLVKTRGPRGTVHLLPSRDLPMWLGALSAMPPPPYVQGRNALMTSEQTRQVVDAITDALHDAELTTDELTEAIVARTGPWAGDLVLEAFQGNWPRWTQALDAASRHGALCFGPSRGRKVTYTSPQRWLPGLRPAEPATALTGLVRRYLYAYGPATPQYFAQWLAVPRTWAAKLFASLADQLQPVEVEGTTAWVVAEDTATTAEAPRGLRLLPYFDAYAVGSQPRELLFPGPAAERALAGGQAGHFPVLLVDGVVVGVWHLRRSGRKLQITVEPLERLSARQRRELDEQVERIGEFLGSRPELTIGQVTTGAHA